LKKKYCLVKQEAKNLLNVSVSAKSHDTEKSI